MGRSSPARVARRKSKKAEAGAPEVPQGISREKLDTYRAELVGQRDRLVQALRELDARGKQVAAELTKVAGQIAAVDHMTGAA